MSMSKQGWRSEVTVGSKKYMGDPRARRGKSKYAAARAALMGLGRPYSTGRLSNIQVAADLERYCREVHLYPPSYSFVSCGVSGGRRRRRRRRKNQLSANIGLHTGLGPHLYVSPGLSLWRSPMQSANIVDDHLLIKSKHISMLDDVIKRFQSHEPNLALGVEYNEDTYDFAHAQWSMGCAVKFGALRAKFSSGAFCTKQEAKDDVARRAYEWIARMLKGTVSHAQQHDLDVSTSKLYMQRNGDAMVDEIDTECKAMLAQVCHNLLEPAVQDDVHAAILMTTDHQSAKASIITVASGTGFCKRSADKSLVFDCHAEMLVRKGLIEFLFKQMETAGTPSSIFTRAAGKHSLKDAVRFHLFVNKIPCGDACIPVGSKNKGDLRYRNTDGEGNLLDPKGDPSTNKMCCSAKIALWNVVGVQGAHLSQFLTHPVYLSTILVKGLKTDAEEAQLK